MSDPEARRERIATWVKWGVGLGAAAAISPFVFFAVKGLIGLALAAATALVIIQFARPFANLVAAWRMKAIVAVAEANPIETMRDLFMEKSKALEQADVDIQAFDTEIRNFADQVVDFKAQYPEEAEKYDELLERMREALKAMKAEQKLARAELEKFRQSIKKAEAIYKMALAAARVTKLSGRAEAQVFAQIRQEVAIDSVRTQLNRAFSGLDTALERRASVQQALPPAKHAEVIDVTPARESQGVGKGRS